MDFLNGAGIMLEYHGFICNPKNAMQFDRKHTQIRITPHEVSYLHFKTKKTAKCEPTLESLEQLIVSRNLAKPMSRWMFPRKVNQEIEKIKTPKKSTK